MSLVATHLSPEVDEVQAAVLDLKPGDKLHIRDSREGAPREVIWSVVKRIRGGWLLEDTSGSRKETDRFEPFADERIRDLRFDGCLVPAHRNPTGMSVEKLRRVLAPRDSKSQRLRLELDRRFAYCKRVDDLLYGRELVEVSSVASVASVEGTEAKETDDTPDVPEDRAALARLVASSGTSIPVMPLERACELAAERTYADMEEAWRQELYLIRVRELAQKDLDAKPAANDPFLTKSNVLKKPSARLVADWWKLRNSSELPDLILTPDWTSRGNRTERKTELLDGRTVYSIMDEFGDRYFAVPEKVSVRKIYSLMDKRHPGFRKVIASHVSVQRYFDRRYEDRYELACRQDGVAKANDLFAVHLRTRRPPLPLMEVEIDHCVADLIVVDEESRRPLGRPYVTAMIDRCTRMILGIHLSFEVPSWASVARCMTHAFWPKDLREFRRSSNPDDEFALDHEWPCEGIPDVIVTDRGREFVSGSMEASAAALGFGHIALPGRSPWLKGTIERFFKTMHAQVYSDVHGKTFSNVVEKGDYQSVERADVSLSELRRRLLKWIVDDYNAEYHIGLNDYPLRAWRVRSAGRRIEPAPSLARLQQVLGTYTKLMIGDHGMVLNTHRYWHESMQQLRNTEKPGTKYHVRYDPFDIGSIWFLPREGTSYVRAWSDSPETTDGVSVYVSKVRRAAIKRFGHRMDPDDDRRIIEEIDMLAGDAMAGNAGGATIGKVARYFLPNGAFFTPISDWDGVPPGFAMRRVDGGPAFGGPDVVAIASDLPGDGEPTPLAVVEVAACVPEDPEEAMRRQVDAAFRELLDEEEG